MPINTLDNRSFIIEIIMALFDTTVSAIFQTSCGIHLRGLSLLKINDIRK